MSATLLDERRYRKLLDVTLPVAIRTEQEYRRLLNAAAVLMERPEDEITEEQRRLLELLSKTQARQLADLFRVPIDLFL